MQLFSELLLDLIENIDVDDDVDDADCSGCSCSRCGAPCKRCKDHEFELFVGDDLVFWTSDEAEAIMYYKAACDLVKMWGITKTPEDLVTLLHSS